MFRIAFLFTLAASLFAADQTWTHLQSENFELYTTAGEKRGREAILYYEQVRGVFSKMFKSVNASKMPVRIIAFRNEKEFTPFRPGQAAAAYYSPGIERDSIVMQSIVSENYPVAVHEYMHRVVHDMGLELPIWLNEGVAELFATLKPMGDKVQMGQMDAGRAIVLRTNKMIPFADFLTVDHNSPSYNERDKAGIFYAQAFALAHMLYYGEGYKGNFGNLQLAYQKSKDPAAVFQSIYGRPLEQVQRDLEKYMRQDRFFYGMVDLKLEKSAAAVEARPVEEYESKIMLAELYRVAKNWDESARLYEAAAKLEPARPEAEEGLGWLALYQNKHAEVLPHFTRGIELGSKRPLVFEHAARLGWKDPQRAYAYMKKALELDPTLEDGVFNLGTMALNAKEPRAALDALNTIKKVTPEKASALFRAKAHAYVGLNQFDDARKNAELAKQYAKTDVDRNGAVDLLAYFEQRDRYSAPSVVEDGGAPKLTRAAPPGSGQTERVYTPRLVREPRKVTTGALLDVACQGKQARLTVAAEGTGAKALYWIADPEQIDVRNGEGVTHEFTCGPQKNTRVKLEFADGVNAPAGVAGVVRSIEFIK